MLPCIGYDFFNLSFCCYNCTIKVKSPFMRLTLYWKLKFAMSSCLITTGFFFHWKESTCDSPWRFGLHVEMHCRVSETQNQMSELSMCEARAFAQTTPTVSPVGAAWNRSPRTVSSKKSEKLMHTVQDVDMSGFAANQRPWHYGLLVLQSWWRCFIRHGRLPFFCYALCPLPVSSGEVFLEIREQFLQKSSKTIF